MAITKSLKHAKIQKAVRSLFTVALLSCGLFYQQVEGALITGNITFAGAVTLDIASAGIATTVTAWSGLAAGLPQVQSDDGDFSAFVTPGDGVTFHAPWPFTSGAIPSFWSVDGFTFDLTSSSITAQVPGAVIVDAVGTISGNSFDSTPGTFHFTTQDPSANALFSFSAASSAVPEPATMISLLSGSSLLGALMFIRRCRA
jgi:hypothetical protein